MLKDLRAILERTLLEQHRVFIRAWIPLTPELGDLQIITEKTVGHLLC